MAKLQPITGTVLRWALEDAGIKPHKAEIQLGFPDGSVTAWMTEAEQPNQGQLALLAKRLGRPSSFFFLAQPPKVAAVPVEFRRFAGTSKKPGQETLDGIRLAGRIQKTTAWVREEAQLGPVKVPHLVKSQPAEEAAETLRKWMKWSTAWQVMSANSDAAVTKAFRAALEDRGIVVMHLSLEEGLTRGFSLASNSAPVIAANTKDPYRARLFSYAHELVHIATSSTSVCDVHESSDGLESFCNRVAAALLMPKKEFRAHVIAKMGSAKLATIDDVSAVRARFRVSLRAAAIRAENLGLGVSGLYDHVNKVAESKSKGGGGGGGRTKDIVRVDEYGSGFIRTVESGVKAGVLRDVQAATLLRLSETEWNKARDLAASRLSA